MAHLGNGLPFPTLSVNILYLDYGKGALKTLHGDNIKEPHRDKWSKFFDYIQMRPQLKGEALIIQGGFFDWSPLKCLSMELVLAPQFRTGPPPTHNVIKFVKKLQYNT